MEKTTLILIEDDKEFIKEFCDVFEGCKVSVVRYADQALEAAKDGVDIVLTKMKLPGVINGLAIPPAIRAVAPGVIILGMSCKPTSWLLSEALKAGFHDMLKRPKHAQELKEVIEGWMKK